ncbi:tetratricopeptide repeat protein [Rubrivirga sp.]|uniref:tetratricopeptide repeat protein n=1 Tax=Rubrivirga sp. TaxID=1885344 RepID=UPI003B516983
MSDPALQRWRRVDALLAQALEREPGDRDRFLRAACADAPDLGAEVRSLLDTSDAAARAVGETAVEFAGPLVAGAERPPEEPDLASGARLGPYRIEGECGRGGMGVVYRATRADGTFEKGVALKLVKRGMDTDEVLRRFQRERQILAGLEHAGIARLLDAGAAPDGRPYLVMEHVEGEPITGYAERHRLGVEARLALVEQACEAVQHAHRRLVVHRDLKPSNVLVVEDEAGEPHVKLLDFGIARLLDTDEAVTRTGRPLTPAYAAPEQRRGEAVTTATDVYALGVLLYELLAGRRPPSPPGPPSAAVEDARLRRRLRGDLDTIVQTALRDRPDERYASVGALLDDVRRYRAGLPIRARPATVGYRARRFAGRHRAGVVATAALAVLAAVVAVLYVRGIEHEKEAAQHEAARAQRMTAVLGSLLETADPYTLSGRRGDSLLLARGQDLVADDLAGEPDLQARLLTVLGRVYRERGQYEQAGALLDQAREITEAALPPPSPGAADAYRQLGGLYTDTGRHADARRAYRRALAMERDLYGPDAPQVFVTLSLLAQVEALDGRKDEAERMHRSIVALSRRVHSPTDPAHIVAVWKLSRVLYMRGKYADAEGALGEVLALRRERFGEAHPEVAHARLWLGLVRTDRGDFEGAEAEITSALALQRRLLGPEHADVAESLFGLGLLANERGRYREAAGWIERSVAMSGQVLGEDHTTTAFRTLIWGDVLRQGRAFPRALDATARAEAAYRRALDDRSVWVGVALAQRGRTLSDAGDIEEAGVAFREALRRIDPARAPRFYYGAQTSYAEWLVRTGRPAEAEPLLREALAALRSETAARHDRAVLHATTALGACLAAQGRARAAAPFLREVTEITEAHYGSANPRTREARRQLRALRL